MSILVVVAHPDDEVLWLFPAVARADLVIATYAREPWNDPLTRGREQVRQEFAVPMEFLPLESARVFRQSDWERRKPMPHGVELLESCPADAHSRYVSNFSELLSLLGPRIEHSTEIYSHNPWGEYGHEEHIQVWRAVSRLAEEFGKTLWVWDGPSNEALLTRGNRMRDDHYSPLPTGLGSVELKADLARFREFKRLYQRHDAWTRGPDYEPPERSRYLEAVREGVLALAERPSPSAT